MKRKIDGKRERQARKRHRRALYWNGSWGAGVDPLKVGRKHMSRCFNRSYSQAVAESEKRTNGAPEIN